MKFPARSAFPSGAFETTLEYAARSFRAARLSRHRPARRPRRLPDSDLQAVAAKLNREWAATPVRVHSSPSITARAYGRLRQALKRNAASAPTRSAATPALADTSLMLAIDPALVRADRLHDGTPLGRRRGRVRRSAPLERGAGQERRRPDRRAKPSPRSRTRSRAALSEGRPLEQRPSSCTSGVQLSLSAEPLRHLAAPRVGCSAHRPRCALATPARAATAAAARSPPSPGMPPVIDPANLYSETGAGQLSDGGRAARCRASTCRTCSSNDVYVIDPATLQGGRRFQRRHQPAARRAVVGPEDAVGRQQRREHAPTAA